MAEGSRNFSPRQPDTTLELHKLSKEKKQKIIENILWEFFLRRRSIKDLQVGKPIGETDFLLMKSIVENYTDPSFSKVEKSDSFNEVLLNFVLLAYKYVCGDSKVIEGFQTGIELITCFDEFLSELQVPTETFREYRIECLKILVFADLYCRKLYNGSVEDLGQLAKNIPENIKTSLKRIFTSGEVSLFNILRKLLFEMGDVYVGVLVGDKTKIDIKACYARQGQEPFRETEVSESFLLQKFIDIVLNQTKPARPDLAQFTGNLAKGALFTSVFHNDFLVSRELPKNIFKSFDQTLFDNLADIFEEEFLGGHNSAKRKYQPKSLKHIYNSIFKQKADRELNSTEQQKIFRELRTRFSVFVRDLFSNESRIKHPSLIEVFSSVTFTDKQKVEFLIIMFFESILNGSDGYMYDKTRLREKANIEKYGFNESVLESLKSKINNIPEFVGEVVSTYLKARKPDQLLLYKVDIPEKILGPVYKKFSTSLTDIVFKKDFFGIRFKETVVENFIELADNLTFINELGNQASVVDKIRHTISFFQDAFVFVDSRDWE